MGNINFLSLVTRSCFKDAIKEYIASREKAENDLSINRLYKLSSKEQLNYSVNNLTCYENMVKLDAAFSLFSSRFMFRYEDLSYLDSNLHTVYMTSFGQTYAAKYVTLDNEDKYLNFDTLKFVSGSELEDHSERCELLGSIIDIVEDFLEEKGINIENDERSGDEENSAIIYGEDYGNLSSSFEHLLECYGFFAKSDTAGNQKSIGNVKVKKDSSSKIGIISYMYNNEIVESVDYYDYKSLFKEIKEYCCDYHTLADVTLFKDNLTEQEIKNIYDLTCDNYMPGKIFCL